MIFLCFLSWASLKYYYMFASSLSLTGDVWMFRFSFYEYVNMILILFLICSKKKVLIVFLCLLNIFVFISHFLIRRVLLKRSYSVCVCLSTLATYYAYENVCVEKCVWLTGKNGKFVLCFDYCLKSHTHYYLIFFFFFFFSFDSRMCVRDVIF